MSYTSRLAYETLRSKDSATFTGSYQTLGTPLANSASIVKFVNNSTVGVTISIDGVNDHDVSPAGSFWLYDATSNSPKPNSIFTPAGTQFFVKGSAGTGNVYLVTQYIITG